jgi:iron(III) transport system ATP-binding protein
LSKEVSALELVDVTKQFGSTTVVDTLSIDCRPGEIIVLLGPSGCGKSTTLRMVSGFEDITSGEIRVAGKPVSQPGKSVPPEKRNMSMIFQSYAVWPHLTTAENVAFGLKVRGQRGTQLKEGVTKALQSVDLSPDTYADRYPHELSGGQQQRVALARALAVQPKVLLLDEPLSNLDAKLRDVMRDELRAIHERTGFTGLYVTHDQMEALTLGDRIVLMNGGHTEQIATPLEIYRRPASLFAASFIGQATIVTCERVDDEFVKSGELVFNCARHAGEPEGDLALVIRPTNTRIVHEDIRNPGHVLVGRVDDALFAGSYNECLVSFPGMETSIKVHLRPFEQVEVGQQIRLGFEDLTVVPAA